MRNAHLMCCNGRGNQTPRMSNSHSSYGALERVFRGERGGSANMIMSPLHRHIEGDSCTLYLSQQQREGERKLFLHLFCFEQVEKGGGGPDMSGAALVVALVMQMSQRGSHTLVSLPTPAGVYSSECAGARVVEEARWYKFRPLICI